MPAHNERHHALRREIWERLASVAVPDSRFHADFLEFIPDFFGSALCASALAEDGRFRDAGLVMVTPDNGLRAVREQVLASGRLLLMPTYRLGRGFMIIDPEDVPAGQECLGSTLDGAELFGTPATVARIAPHAPLTLLVAGACGVTTEGVRVHDGPNYFDLEWATLRHLGLVDEATTVAICVHDVQVVDERIVPEPWEVVADVVITPTRTLAVQRPYPKPDRLRAERFPPSVLAGVLTSLDATP